MKINVLRVFALCLAALFAACSSKPTTPNKPGPPLGTSDQPATKATAPEPPRPQTPAPDPVTLKANRAFKLDTGYLREYVDPESDDLAKKVEGIYRHEAERETLKDEYVLFLADDQGTVGMACKIPDTGTRKEVSLDGLPADQCLSPQGWQATPKVRVRMFKPIPDDREISLPYGISDMTFGALKVATFPGYWLVTRGSAIYDLEGVNQEKAAALVPFYQHHHLQRDRAELVKIKGRWASRAFQILTQKHHTMCTDFDELKPAQKSLLIRVAGSAALGLIRPIVGDEAIRRYLVNLTWDEVRETNLELTEANFHSDPDKPSISFDDAAWNDTHARQIWKRRGKTAFEESQKVGKQVLGATSSTPTPRR